MCLYFGTKGTTTDATTSKQEHTPELIDVINQNTVCSAAVLSNSVKMLDSFIVLLAITILITISVYMYPYHI